MNNQKEKILFIISRYGLDVHGGAEFHCREIAERLTDRYEVEVATTCALDYLSWKNYYRAGTERVNGVLLRKFKVSQGRERQHGFIETLLRSDLTNPDYGKGWIIGQGPHSKDLFDHIHNHHHEYKKIIVFQYLYTLSYFAIKLIPKEKLIFVPLVHDEPQAYYPLFREEFRKAEWIIYNTEIEKNIANRLHYVNEKKSVIAGMGVDLPKEFSAKSFREKFKIPDDYDYLIYVGRISADKRVNVLIDDFIDYKKANPNTKVKLVLVGKEVIKPKRHKDIILTGFISEEDKFGALEGALALVNPSPFESLSIIVLESFLVKRPIIVNAFCEVLKEHCIKPNAGLWYESVNEFFGCVDYLLTHKDIATQMGLNGYEYAQKNYRWEEVMRKWVDVIES